MNVTINKEIIITLQILTAYYEKGGLIQNDERINILEMYLSVKVFKRWNQIPSNLEINNYNQISIFNQDEKIHPHHKSCMVNLGLYMSRKTGPVKKSLFSAQSHHVYSDTKQLIFQSLQHKSLRKL